MWYHKVSCLGDEPVQVWRLHDARSETTYWFFHLKDGRWYRFNQQEGRWDEIRYNPSILNQTACEEAVKKAAEQPPRLSCVSRQELETEWLRMFQKYNPPLVPSDIAP